MRAHVGAMLLAGVAVLSGCSRDGCTERSLSCGTGPSTLALVTAQGRGPESAPMLEIERIARRQGATGIADVRRDPAALAKAAPGTDRGG